MTPSPPIPEPLWSRIPEDAREALAAAFGALLARVARLEAQLARNSSNSSTPPSADPPSVPPTPPKPRSKRKRGGQPGHKGHRRTRLPAALVSHVVAFVSKACVHCEKPLPAVAGPGDPAPTWHQSVELPERPAVVTEYQGHARTCPCCAKVTREAIPAGIRAEAFGPRLAAAFSLLAAGQHVSVRGLVDVASCMFGVPVSAGTLVRLQGRMSAALAAPAAAIAREVADAPAKNADETGWKQAGRRRWMWVAVTASAVTFLIHACRGREALHALLGGEPRGVVVSDRWSAYLGIPPDRRQICWAHLKRDFKAMEEAGGEAGGIGRDLGMQVGMLFLFWRMFKAGKRKRPWLIRQIEGLIRPDVRMLLEQGRECGHAPTESKCAGIESVEASLWTFAHVEGVEPTNNAAERAVRPAVVRRKKSFGSASEAGETWLCRMLSVTQTLKMRGLDVLDYLARALQDFRHGLSAPLIPAAH